MYTLQKDNRVVLAETDDMPDEIHRLQRKTVPRLLILQGHHNFSYQWPPKEFAITPYLDLTFIDNDNLPCSLLYLENIACQEI